MELFTIRTKRFFSRACIHVSMFPRIDLAAYREQQQQIAEQLKEHPPPPVLAPQPKRAVGRPKTKRSAEQVLTAAAAADTLQLPPFKRGKYTRWFDSPYINDILAAFARTGSARATVTALQKDAPDDRYARLSHSTVASWFEDGKLKSQYQQEIDSGRAGSTYAGRSPVLQAAPGAEEAICDHLLQLRKAGMPLNSHVVRWVMLAVLEKHPAVLQQLALSQPFISRFVRNNPRLQFRWRARTTAASKLPDDWEEQGIHMAQRMGATMQMLNVSIEAPMRAQAHCSEGKFSMLTLCVPICTDPSLPCYQHGSDGCAFGVCIVMDIRDGG